MFWYRRLVTCIRYKIYMDYLKGQSSYGSTDLELAAKLGTALCHDVENFFPQKMFIRYRTYIGQRVRINSHFHNAEQMLERMDVLIRYLESGDYVHQADKLIGLVNRSYRLSDWLLNNEGYTINIEEFWEEYNRKICLINRYSLELKEANDKKCSYYSRCFLSTLIDVPNVIKALYNTLWEK